MKSISTLLITFLISFLGFGQTAKIDSLKSQYKSSFSKSKKIDILNKLCNELLEHSHFDKSKIYYDEFLRLAKENKNPTYISKAHQILARANEIERNIEIAKKHLRKSIKLNIKNKNYALLAKDYNMYGSIFNRSQKYDSAIIYFKKSIALYKKIRSENGTAYLNLGIALDNSNKEKEAIKYTIKAIDIAEEYKDYELQVRGLTSLGGHSIKN